MLNLFVRFLEFSIFANSIRSYAKIFIMNALAIHLYLTIRYINLSFNYFCNFYRIIVFKKHS